MKNGRGIVVWEPGRPPVKLGIHDARLEGILRNIVANLSGEDAAMLIVRISKGIHLDIDP